MNNTLSKEDSFKLGQLKDQKSYLRAVAGYCNWSRHKLETILQWLLHRFLQYCFCKRILSVLNRKIAVQVEMLCHEGADFSHVVTEMAKNAMTATSNVYQVYLLVGRQLLHVPRMRIFDFLKRLYYFNCSIEGGNCYIIILA